MNALIRSTGTYVPVRRMSNDELPKHLDTSDEWIVSHTGIRNRHLAADDRSPPTWPRKRPARPCTGPRCNRRRSI